MGTVVNQANEQALDVLKSFDAIAKLGGTVEADKQKYIAAFGQVSAKVTTLRENAATLFYIYKDKIEGSMSARRYLMTQQKNMLETVTAMLGLSLVILFLFNFGHKREFCFVFTNLAWFISFLGLLGLIMTSYAAQENWMKTKDYCTKENQDNFSNFERDIFGTITQEWPLTSYDEKAVPVADDIHLFA